MKRPGSLSDLVQQFSARLENGGLHDALAFLNARTRHRYTGVFRFEPPMLQSVELYDRENPPLRFTHNVPLRDTYCAFVAAAGLAFDTENSLFDSRLKLHSARETIRAYHAVPLYGDGEVCFGSLCHWDVRPRLIPTAEIPLLLAVAAIVAPIAARHATLQESSRSDREVHLVRAGMDSASTRTG